MGSTRYSAKNWPKEEMDNERYFDIPEEVRDIYKIYRPAPLQAFNLEKALDTKAKIYYKSKETTLGSHKLNSAVAWLTTLRRVTS